MNTLRLGDERQLALHGWTEHSYPFPVRVRGFKGNYVLVEAMKRSEDPMVDDEWLVPFSWLKP